MCGIAGELQRGRTDRVEQRHRVQRAVHALRHRGPDDVVVADIDELGAWGMCRLAIRDPSPAGRQPFRLQGVEIVFNGEIYNTVELRRLLKPRGHVFRTSCDTEVLLAAYVVYGVDAFGLLDGMFAVAVVDRRSNELVLARDEFGVKPLFVRSTPGHLAFGSEPKALRELDALGAGIDMDHLERFLHYEYVAEPSSPWKDVRRVRCGAFEVYSLDRLDLTRSGSFHQPRDGAASASADPRTWVDALDDAMRQSVHRQMVSDRPLGVFLSGGIDSTLVSAYASEARPGLRAFGVSIPWQHDERRHMEEACRRLGLDLSVVTMTAHDFDRLVDRILDTYDEPFADCSALPTMLVSESAANDVRVVLTGDGGDELFGGYTRYLYARRIRRLGRLPLFALRSLSAGMRAARFAYSGLLVDRIADDVRAGGDGYRASLALRTQREAAAILGRAPGAQPALVSRSSAGGWRSSDVAGASMAIDIDEYLPADILTKVDRATMSVSLEARVPLLGAPVAALASKMPPSIKINDGCGKWPLKQLLSGRGFSDAFVHRPKVGFSLPISDLMRGAITRRPEYEELIRDPLPPIDRAVSGACLDELLGGSDTGHAVWTILVLSGWLIRNA